jgi:hypothetical protein
MEIEDAPRGRVRARIDRLIVGVSSGSCDVPSSLRGLRSHATVLCVNSRMGPRQCEFGHPRDDAGGVGGRWAPTAPRDHEPGQQKRRRIEQRRDRRVNLILESPRERRAGGDRPGRARVD